MKEKIARHLAYQALQDTRLNDEDKVWAWVVKEGFRSEWYEGANQILTLIKQEIRKSLLTDEEIREAVNNWVRKGALLGQSIQSTILQAQLDKVLKILT